MIKISPIVFFALCQAVWLGSSLSTLAQTSKSSDKPPTGKEKFEWVASEPKPDWIWPEGKIDDSPIFLRKSFNAPAKLASAWLYVTCDNYAEVWINGQRVGEAPDWGQPLVRFDALQFLKPNARNVIAVMAKNRGGTAAFVAKLRMDGVTPKPSWEISDSAWKFSREAAEGWREPDFDDSGWTGKLISRGKFGVGPWGIAGLAGPGGGGTSKKSPLTAEDITVVKGFAVELLYEVPREEQGSWVALTKLPGGKLIASDQGKAGMFEITIADSAEGPKASVEKVPANVSGAWGMTWAGDSLYAHLNGKTLVRIHDSTGDGKLDAVEELPGAGGGGEHGNHAVIPAEDGEHLYVDAGNSTNLMEVTSSRVPTWDEDLLLPRQWDARGHARGRLAPGGWVAKFDPDSKEYELFAMGFRNQYDIALTRHGDLFTYDADMEWDMGMPWYRPTRICHVVSGADFGWRSGTGKWPTYYEDSLPPLVEIGPGSPTGVVAGIGAEFPRKYRDAIYALDWTFGTIYAIHLEEDGAGYRGMAEPFVYGAPLPVTDAIVGDDGALYFTIGGRNTQSALYRVTWTGAMDAPEKDEPSDKVVAVIELAGENEKTEKGRQVLLRGRPVTWDQLKYLLEAERPDRIELVADQQSGRSRVEMALDLFQSLDLKNVDVREPKEGDGIAPPKPPHPREIRRRLESYHGKEADVFIEEAWPYLSSEDRFLRHAARIAIESQPEGKFAHNVFREPDPQARITGAVALARKGNGFYRDKLLASLLELDPAALNDSQLLGLLRAYALTFIRLGRPAIEEREMIISELDPFLPHANANVNTELVRLLVYLESPSVIGKAMDLIVNRGKPEIPDWQELANRNPGYGKKVIEMLENHPPSREIGYAFMLRNLKKGWTLKQRRQYFEFLNEAAKFSGGASFTGFLANLRDEALGNCTNAERSALADVTGESFNPVPDFEIVPPRGPGRNWTLEEAAKPTGSGELRKANYETGRGLFHAIGCAACHRFSGLGGDIGPDLTSIPNKFDSRYVLEAIIEPSKVISDQYGSFAVTMKNGDVHTGLVVEKEDAVDIYPPVNAAEAIEVKKADVEKIEQVPVSQMPPGLINGLNPEELRDLLAYLMSGGDPEAKVYGK